MEKVYCSNCKHFSKARYSKGYCYHPKYMYDEDYPSKKIVNPGRCGKINFHNDCSEFTPTVRYRIKKLFNWL